MTIPLHGHTHQQPVAEPITRYQDDPRWQELNAKFNELRKGAEPESSNSRNLWSQLSWIAWDKREIERIYEQLDARKALISRILFDHPAGASLSSTDAEELAQAIALKLI